MEKEVDFNNFEEKREKGIVAYNFNVEVIKKPDCENHFTVRVPLPNGGIGVAVFGFVDSFNEFIKSL